jgi:hypothetical protein
MAPVIECLPSKCEALNLNPNIAKKNSVLEDSAIKCTLLAIKDN